MSSQLTAVILPAFIPSPSQGVWHVFGLPLRAYALCILAGIFAGYWLGRKRWVARGGSAEVLADVIMWAVPFGLVGARIYHVLTDWGQYFGADSPDDPIDALKIWHGGLGIWGAIAFGALGAWIACRRHKVPFLAVADAMAPGIALAQVLGRFGNYFNQELYGRVTDLPWALEIDTKDAAGNVIGQTLHHPTFLYEAIWNLGVIALVIWADRRWKLGHGRAFALYVAAYTVGRGFIETLRVDAAEHVLGLRLNVWTSIILFVLAVVYFVISARTRPGQEDIRTTPAAGDDTPGEALPAEPTPVVEGTRPEDEAPAGTAADGDSGPDRPADAESPSSRPTGASDADRVPAGDQLTPAATPKADATTGPDTPSTDGSRD
ncbi:prolipoprotein diacylglyceryl transferase [Kribbella sp. CA-253562]|uniref:prolipoprotein diacylglyceryl transferase n=1 Tax=Kribbella sp. CA-253562 TaxID=3239942 RepID=UPI003D8EB24D